MTAGPPHHYPPPGAPPPEDPSPSRSAPDAPYAPYGTPTGHGAAEADGSSYPPPGPGRGNGPPGHSYATHRPAAPLPGSFGGAAHRPGAIPLRPLGLGAMYDGAFRIIRYNPKATVGAAVLVTAAAMVIPIILTALLTFLAGATVDLSGEAAAEDLTTSEVLGLLGVYGSLILSSFLSWIGLTLVTGMIAHVVRAATLGRTLGLLEAWDATHGKRWRLLGLTTLVTLALVAIWLVWGLLLVVVVVVVDNLAVSILWGVLSFAGTVCLMVWTWVRLFYLPVPALMLEDVGVLGSIGRGYRLTKDQFWRTLGIALLTYLISSMAGGLLATPISFVFQIAGFAVPEYSALLLVVGQAIASVIQNAFVAPFVSAVTTLQYVDQRMRKEAYDVELMGEAGLLPR